MAANIRNRFYAAFALAMAVFTLVAFARTYYLRHWFDVPPITVLLHLHSIVFTAWVVLFVIQTRLIAAQNYRTHMQLGIAGMALAVLVVIVGFVLVPTMYHQLWNSAQAAVTPEAKAATQKGLTIWDTMNKEGLFEPNVTAGDFTAQTKSMVSGDASATITLGWP